MVTAVWVAAFVFSSIVSFLSEASVFFLFFAFDFAIFSAIRGGCVAWADRSVPD